MYRNSNLNITLNYNCNWLYVGLKKKNAKKIDIYESKS